MDFSERSSAPEIMDDLNCSGEVVHQTLRELEFINKWLGGNQVTIDALNQLVHDNPHQQLFRIADLGCGSGNMLRIINEWARSNNLNTQLTGIDANAHIIRYAEKNLADLPEIQLRVMDILSPQFIPSDYDIIIGTLFFHHFSDDELIQFFSSLKHHAGVGFIINDIHRHFFAYHSIRILTSLFSKSSMVKYDAPLSVMRAFSKREITNILQLAGIPRFQIRWKWAFRWQVVGNFSGNRE